MADISLEKEARLKVVDAVDAFAEIELDDEWRRWVEMCQKKIDTLGHLSQQPITLLPHSVMLAKNQLVSAYRYLQDRRYDLSIAAASHACTYARGAKPYRDPLETRLH